MVQAEQRHRGTRTVSRTVYPCPPETLRALPTYFLIHLRTLRERLREEGRDDQSVSRPRPDSGEGSWSDPARVTQNNKILRLFVSGPDPRPGFVYLTCLLRDQRRSEDRGTVDRGRSRSTTRYTPGVVRRSWTLLTDTRWVENRHRITPVFTDVVREGGDTRGGDGTLNRRGGSSTTPGKEVGVSTRPGTVRDR